MATQLAAQLAQIAANSRSSLNVKAQRAAHSKSLIFEPKEAASQSYQTLFALCHQGFEELCQLDSRFAPFQLTIFSEQSQHEDRTQLNAEQNAELDRRIESFLRLVGARLRLMPAIRALEWLIRRFRCVSFVYSAADLFNRALLTVVEFTNSTPVYSSLPFSRTTRFPPS